MLNFSMSKQAGFTLVELVTTIILISILAVVVLPRLFTQSSYSAYSLRNEFISELRQVQQKALNNTDRCFRVTVSGTGYQVSQFPARNGAACSGTALSPNPLYTQAFQGSAQLVLVSTNSSNFSLDFNINGRPSLACNGPCINVIANDTVMINVSSEGYIYAN
ncbi:type II secretion system protein [Shewanella baltica]|uniref:type II secretion system protein n=1 Tax=Shewanella baltica TaxID=62322 RepID=UPI0001530DE3|nr:prepilin-type N-terminal cleavage/methylation domain-containing protein [Shewanella baltica]ACK45051.1 MSHA pilin protein MshC [Shewanella baltica OS223]MCS6154537.1 type II secretion system protein [Shewanella baltica]MCS6234956.1 type II secretion system protein [Shewanella baltica]MCS6260968.1 type II secretion system protein [Shewanella baltica]MCS6269372.1 type II secretion system protein [Shewanella baltica]